jgi:5'-nucleotidase
MTLSRRALGALLALPAIRPARAQAAARIRLLHMNDFHSRHEGAETTGSMCRAGRPCLGGSARLVAAFAAARAEAAAEGRTTLALDAGDQFQGTLFYQHYRGLTEAGVLRRWGVQAMVPGNHEFNHGPANLARFLDALGQPLLAANLDAAAEPALAGRVVPHRLLTLGGARIGLIGLALEETPSLSSPGPNLRFTDAAEAAARAIAALRAAGATTIIALTHRGFAADLAMAGAVPGIDVIVGGHSHTTVSPTRVVDGPDRAVRIVQTGALGRYAGVLDLDLDARGLVVTHGAGLRELTGELAEDPDTAAYIAEQSAPLQALRQQPAGRTGGAFEIETCRTGECALGNLVADAMLAATPTAEVALMNGGGIRASLPAGEVTLGDVLTVLPFGNTLATARLRGGDLLAALEHGLSRAGQGGFPQVGGIAVEWAPGAPAGQRLLSARILAGPQAGPVDPARTYLLVTNNFLRNGGDAYVMLRDRALAFYDAGAPLEDALIAQMARGLAEPRLDGRLSAR